MERILLKKIVNNADLHSRWLNTLSMMENVGAKKIKKCEHPVFVNEIMLKHAAEEARHAHYLKKQIHKVMPNACPTYESKYVLAPHSSQHYLHMLDIDVCRYLKREQNYQQGTLKYAAYLLVTYAIEVRADQLYPLYQTMLEEIDSLVSVKHIILEEVGHLQEMRKQLEDFSTAWQNLCDHVCMLEKKLYLTWTEQLKQVIFN